MIHANNNAAEPSNVATQYETLRSGAVGGALPLDARAGLMLFLQRVVRMGVPFGHHGCIRAGDWLSAIELEAARRIQNRDSHFRRHGDRSQLLRSNTMNESLKVQPHHLERGAYLYVRQSSMRQVIENVESTKRQYALRSRAIALGWRDNQIIVIDSDQGETRSEE